MKKNVVGILGFFISAHIACAAVSVCIDTPAAAHDDSETSAMDAMPLMSPKARILRFELSLDAVTGNSAELFLGKSRGGKLSLAGTQAIIGWEKGAWVLRSGDLRQSFSADAADANVPCKRKLTASVHVKPTLVENDLHGWRDEIQISHITFSEDRWGAGIPMSRSPVEFPGLSPDSEILKAWFGYHGWDAFRVVSRGGAGGASATVKVVEPGMVLILR